MENTQIYIFDVKSIYIDSNANWWTYNQNNHYSNVIIISAHSIGGSYHTIPSEDLTIEVNNVMIMELDLV